MAKSPNVYSTNYVNSGPGVGLSSNNSNSSKGVEGGSKSIDVDRSEWTRALNLAKQIGTGIKTDPAFQYARDAISSPASSAVAASAYNDFDARYGIGYDMDEYYDRLLELTDYNNDWAAEQAQKQMSFQTTSNKAAMAWSAGEAAKSRDWTENLSNTAHQREVKDLLAAGLNPILSANNGAYTGSGATGQSFSSNGAMATPDTAASAALGSVLSQCLSTARDVMITQMNNAQQKYNADMGYASTKLATGASIYNNNNSINAEKAYRKLMSDTDIQKASITAGATRDAAASSAGAMLGAAQINASSQKELAEYNRETQYQIEGLRSETSKYGSDKSLEGTKYQTDNNILKAPYNAGKGMGKQMVEDFGPIINGVMDSVSFGLRNYFGQRPTGTPGTGRYDSAQ